VHMEAGRCMEVVLLRGSAEDFRCFVRAVSNLRAVLCAEPVVLPVLPPSRAQEETSPGSPSPHPLPPLPSTPRATLIPHGEVDGRHRPRRRRGGRPQPPPSRSGSGRERTRLGAEASRVLIRRG
jgi:hypothetical protein